MSRFNQRVTNKTTNREGSLAYKISPEMELYAVVCTASLQPKFYETSKESMERIRTLVGQVDSEFVEKLAVYARENMYLRSVPTVLCVELAKRGSLKAKTVQRVIQRADEINEMLAYYQHANGRTSTKKLNRLSKAIQKGIKRIFETGKFGEYHYGKYNRQAEVMFRDALFLCHPKPDNDEKKELFAKIAANELATPYTWETELSALGQRAYDSDEEKKAAFKTKWEELIDSGKLGYMALMRNLRNILESNVSVSHIEKVCDTLQNPEAVLNSKQLPFRYLSAYRVLKGTPESRMGLAGRDGIESEHTSAVLSALECALKVSAQNIKGFNSDTTVCVAADVSASMQQLINPRSSIQYYDIGLLLGMLLQSRCKAVISGMFGDIWKVIPLPHSNILTNVDEMHNREGEVGYSTNGYKVLEWAISENKKIDKFIIFTDCQLWNSDGGFLPSRNSKMPELWRRYKEINPDAKLYLFDMAGTGTVPLKVEQNDVHLIAGWSDKIFDILDAIEHGKEAVEIIDRIEI